MTIIMSLYSASYKTQGLIKDALNPSAEYWVNAERSVGVESSETDYGVLSYKDGHYCFFMCCISLV